MADRARMPALSGFVRRIEIVGSIAGFETVAGIIAVPGIHAIAFALVQQLSRRRDNSVGPLYAIGRSVRRICGRIHDTIASGPVIPRCNYCTNRCICGTSHDIGRLRRNRRPRRCLALIHRPARWADAALRAALSASRQRPPTFAGFRDDSPARSPRRRDGDRRGAPSGAISGVMGLAPDRRPGRAPAIWRREADWEGCKAWRFLGRGRRHCRLRPCSRTRPGGAGGCRKHQRGR